jgi:hypothetical protein
MSLFIEALYRDKGIMPASIKNIITPMQITRYRKTFSGIKDFNLSTVIIFLF